MPLQKLKQKRLLRLLLAKRNPPKDPLHTKPNQYKATPT